LRHIILRNIFYTIFHCCCWYPCCFQCFFIHSISFACFHLMFKPSSCVLNSDWLDCEGAWHYWYLGQLSPTLKVQSAFSHFSHFIVWHDIHISHCTGIATLTWSVSFNIIIYLFYNQTFAVASNWVIFCFIFNIPLAWVANN